MGLNNWLRTALSRLSGLLRRRPAEPDSISPGRYSSLARFIFQRNHYTKTLPLKPKPNAFLPHPSTLKTSAMWRDSLSDQEIWGIGDLVGNPRNKAPLARADFDLSAVTEAQLVVEPDPQPNNPRHINLCAWPTEKDEQKSIALLLCARSTLRLRNSSG